MPSTQKSIKINAAEFEKALSELGDRCGDMDIRLRSRALEASIKAAGKPVQTLAKKLVPQPGYRGDKPGLKPLRNTIQLRVKQYDRAWVLLVGPKWPAGSHGHNVEFGHRIARSERGRFQNVVGARKKMRPREFSATGRTRAVLFMERAFDQTRGQVQATFDAVVRRIIDETWQTSRQKHVERQLFLFR
jgi:hypothetical protein